MVSLQDFQGQEICTTAQGDDVDSWIFFSPKPYASVLGSYLLFVTVLGPRLMANRKPFELRTAMLCYNMIQILFNAWLLALLQGFFHTDWPFDACHNPKHPNVKNSCKLWWILTSKFFDLLDTVIFVLRKKNKQITFLHIYHHVAVCGVVYMYFNTTFEPQAIFAAKVNAFVHMCMYTYYLLSALGPKYVDLWWKKYLTWMQMIQFFIILYYFLFWCSSWEISNAQKIMGTGFVSSLVILFIQFYTQSYQRKQAEKVL